MTPSEPSYREIPLSKGQIAFVDAADFEWLNQWKWTATFNQKLVGFYALRSFATPTGRGYEYMHRMVMGLTKGDGKQVDHIDPSGTLDNRRSNLRVVEGWQNMANTRQSKLAHTNIDWKSNAWRVRFGHKREIIHVGRFKTFEEAFAAKVKRLRELKGEFCHFTVTDPVIPTLPDSETPLATAPTLPLQITCE